MPIIPIYEIGTVVLFTIIGTRSRSKKAIFGPVSLKLSDGFLNRQLSYGGSNLLGRRILRAALLYISYFAPMLPSCEQEDMCKGR